MTLQTSRDTAFAKIRHVCSHAVGGDTYRSSLSDEEGRRGQATAVVALQMQTAFSSRVSVPSSEASFILAKGSDLLAIASWSFNPSGFFDYWSPELFRICGLDPANGAQPLRISGERPPARP